MKNIKLICIDMDGTLLNHNNELTSENKEALIEAHAKGINIALCTGRIFLSARYYSDLIGIDTPVIASNGAYIKRGYNDEPIFENTMSKDIALAIYNIVKKHGLKINFNSWDTLIREDEVPKEHTYFIMNKILPKERQVKFIVAQDIVSVINNFEGNLLKGIVIEQENLKALFDCKEELRSTFGDRLHVVSSGPDNFEVMVGSSSKGEAVKHLAEILNIKQEEIMCIGDSENDLSMIRYAGVGVAMGNAMDIIKEAATFVTDTNENSGVAKAIKKFVL